MPSLTSMFGPFFEENGGGDVDIEGRGGKGGNGKRLSRPGGESTARAAFADIPDGGAGAAGIGNPKPAAGRCRS